MSQLFNYAAFALVAFIGTRLKNKTALNIDIKLANIFNTKYVANGYTYSYLVGGEKTTAVYYYPQATRSIFLGLSLKF